MSILVADPAPRHAPDHWDGNSKVDWMTKVPTRRLANANQTPVGDTTLTLEQYRRRWVTGRFIEPVAVEPEPVVVEMPKREPVDLAARLATMVA